MSVQRVWQRDPATRGIAEFSECGTYRYWLEIRWGRGRALHFCLLNPSTADERRNDPTVERCEQRSRALRYPAVIVTNIFAFRATDPRKIKAAADPVGPENDRWIRKAFTGSAMTIAAWGTHGSHLGRARQVRAAAAAPSRGLPQLHCLKINAGGEPAHPLYLSYDLRPIPLPLI